MQSPAKKKAQNFAKDLMFVFSGALMQGCLVVVLVSKVQFEIKTTCTKKLCTRFEDPYFEELVTQIDRKEGKGRQGLERKRWELS